MSVAQPNSSHPARRIEELLPDRWQDLTRREPSRQELTHWARPECDATPAEFGACSRAWLTVSETVATPLRSQTGLFCEHAQFCLDDPAASVLECDRAQIGGMP
jgi:hypothetical protein